MKITSKTGLTASPTKKIIRYDTTKTVQLKAIARPAPFMLKPFAGLYNPYSHGCSLLCNHPTNNGMREMLKKAKENWAYEGKTRLLTEEIEAIRDELKRVNTDDHLLAPKNTLLPQVESVPEELFRRYTETDSRPLTPAPTLASAATRASGSRRCVTPDPQITNQIREKTLLILDLRRSHSQETLSYYGSSSLQEPPLIRIQHVATRASSIENGNSETIQTTGKNLSTSTSKKPKNDKKSPNMENGIETDEKTSEKSSEADDDEEFITRRGKRRRRKSRDPSRGPPAFQASMDPETQVATLGTDSYNPSARASLVPRISSQDLAELEEKNKRQIQDTQSFSCDSYLDKDILKELRRELNEEIVDNELNFRRKKALEEALKTISKNKIECEELTTLQKELNVPPVNSNLWIMLPRTFTRASARFELPMNSRILNNMTPIDYARDNISITSSRKLLYNCIFNKYKMELDSDCKYERKLSGQNMQACLNLVMGKPMTPKQSDYFKDLMGWKECDVFDFKTCCGIFALCERLLAPEFCPQLPDRKTDPCHEIETADFEVLTRKLHHQTVDERLVKILNGIKTL